jgi:hypothetical protein
VDSAEEGLVEVGPSVLDRYSPVRVSVLLHLPESNARSFLVASALGGILDREGTRNSLKSAKDATGVLITKKRREVVIGELGIDLRRWQQLVNDWERREIAHRCSPGVVVLFTRPFLEACPACRTELQTTEASVRAASRDRGPGFAESQAKHPFAQSEATLRSTRTTASLEGALPLRVSGTNAPHPTDGVAMRDERGVEEVQPSEVPSEVSSEGPRKRRGRDSKAWRVPPGGYISAWDIGVDGKASG